MALRKSLIASNLILLSSLFLAGCSTVGSLKEMITVTEVITHTIPVVERPKQLSLNDLHFYVVTEDNLDQVENVCERDNSNIVIEKYVDVLAVFGGMDLEGHFYNDLMVLKL